MMAFAEYDSELDFMTATENDNDEPESPIFYRVNHTMVHEEQPLLSSDEDQDGSKSAAKYTVEEAVENMGYGAFQLKIFFVCGLFSATDALEMLLLSVLSPVLRCDWTLSEIHVAFITTVVFVGMFVGSNVWGSWADKYGRLMIMKIAAVWIGYFGIMTAFSPNYSWMLILRGLVGMGFGGAVQSFTMHCEYLPAKYRAKVLIISNVMWALGSTFEVFMAYLIIPTMGWRWLVGVSALPMIITIGCIWFLPESARYLVAAGRKEEAVKVLEQASKMNGKQLPPGELVQSQVVPRGQFSDLFSKQLRVTTCLLWFIWLGTASSYYGIVLAQTEILERNSICHATRSVQKECHCNPLQWDDYMSMIFATLGEFIVIPINLLTIDTIGRRWTILINFLGAGIFFLLVQICSTKIVLTIFIFGVRAFSSGIFNAVYIYTTEVYPTTIRSIGLGSCSAMARIGAMTTPFIAQVMMEWNVRFSLGMYGVMCVACAIAAFFLPVETKGRAMAQSQR